MRRESSQGLSLFLMDRKWRKIARVRRINGYISHMLGKEISSRGENMEMCVDHQLHLVSIWLPNDEKDVAILEPVYRKYKGTPYRVAVFRSGNGNLMTNTAALLKANR